MAKLPTAAKLGTQSISPTSRRQTYDTSAAGEGMANLGRGISQLGSGIESAAARARAEWEAVEQQKAKTDLDKWLFEERKIYEDEKYNLDPAAAKGFADQYSAAFSERAAAKLDETPESSKQYIDGRMGTFHDRIYFDAIGKERKSQEAAAKASVAELTDTAKKNAASLASSPEDFQYKMEWLGGIISDAQSTDYEQYLPPE